MIKESHILNKHFSGFPFSEAGAPTVSIAPFPFLSSVSHFTINKGYSQGFHSQVTSKHIRNTSGYEHY